VPQEILNRKRKAFVSQSPIKMVAAQRRSFAKLEQLGPGPVNVFDPRVRYR